MALADGTFQSNHQKVVQTPLTDALGFQREEMVATLDRSLARAEFSLDGRILDANENFLKVVGYGRQELVGLHHSILVDPAFAATGEYRHFWKKLARGQFVSDKFRRLARNGEDVWIQASYNPVLGADGKPAKVLKLATDITQHEMMARDARDQIEAVSRSQSIAEFNSDGCITFANENFCRMVGYTRKELLGSRHAMLVDGESQDARDHAALWAALLRGEFQAGRFLRVGKGGRVVWMHGTYNPVLDTRGCMKKIVLFANDITESEQRARDADGQLQAISRSAAIIEFLPDGTVLSANDNFCRIFGYAVEEIRAHHHSMFVSPQVATSDTYREFWDRLGRGTFQSAKYARCAKGGRIVWIQASYNPIMDEAGNVMKVVKYATDITEQVVAKDEETRRLRELNDLLELAKLEAENSSKAKSQFLATMSHEIRTPMNGVLGMLEVALRREQPVEQRELLATVRESAWSLLSILNDVLDYSKMEAGELRFEMQPVCQRQLMDAVASTLRSRAEEKGIALRIDSLPDVPEWIEGDPTRIRQVVTNLVANAIKFTDAGSVAVTVRYLASSRGNDLRVEVRDTGIGIPEEALGKLFSRFNQVDASITRRFGGTGLGLAICRQLVEGMGGTIGVESRVGEGSLFWFQLPTRAVEAPEIQEPKDRAALAASAPARLLLVDDHPINRQILARMLEPIGHALVFATNGAQAVKLADETEFDLVLLDVSMPIMDGPSAARLIRAGAGASKNTPIVALTANAMAGDRESYLAAGMNDYLAKPYRFNDLLEVVNRNLAPSFRAFHASGDLRTEVRVVSDLAQADASSLEDVLADLEEWISEGELPLRTAS